MKITLKNGETAEITDTEVKRIAHESGLQHAREAWDSMASRNHQYLCKAKHNIREIAHLDNLPETEDTLKMLLYRNMPDFTHADADLLYEIIEAAIGMHTEKLVAARRRSPSSRE